MTITFQKKVPSDSNKSVDWKAIAREKRLTANSKRILRRQRKNAEKEGIIIPYEPRSQPVDPNAPKLTNHAKRMARKRKKFAAALAEQGLTVEEGGPTYLKTKKKKKKKSAPVLGAEANDHDDEPGTAENPASEEPDVATEETKKKRRKQLKKTKKIEESTLTTETSPEKKSGDLLLPKEENEIKMEVELADEEMATDKANILQADVKSEKKQRFILFVGNLSYETTEAEIRAHFKKIGKIVSIRISKHVDKAMVGKSKGFAHLEVGDEESYLKALSLHHSKLQGRRINVEYSSCQTKDMRVVQKEKTRAIKEAIASGDILDIANPSKSKLKKKQKGKREKDPAKMVWL